MKITLKDVGRIALPIIVLWLGAGIVEVFGLIIKTPFGNWYAFPYVITWILVFAAITTMSLVWFIVDRSKEK